MNVTFPQVSVLVSLCCFQPCRDFTWPFSMKIFFFFFFMQWSTWRKEAAFLFFVSSLKPWVSGFLSTLQEDFAPGSSLFGLKCTSIEWSEIFSALLWLSSLCNMTVLSCIFIVLCFVLCFVQFVWDIITSIAEDTIHFRNRAQWFLSWNWHEYLLFDN